MYENNTRKEKKKDIRSWKKDNIEKCDVVADLVLLPGRLNNTIKAPSEAFCKISSGDMITIQTNICANLHKGLTHQLQTKK